MTVKQMDPILFYEDWGKHKSAVVQHGTKNTSFLRLAALYRDMGIKNHAFILQLHNPELLKIDPWSKDIGIEEMMLIAMECADNPFYFYREVAISPDGSDDFIIRYKAHRGNMALNWLFFNHITTMLVQPRQTGKSYAVDSLMDYLMNIGTTKSRMTLLTKDETTRQSNLARIKKIDEALPFYLKQRGRHDVANTEELSVKKLENFYKGLLPNKSVKLAGNVGRGLTSPIFQTDESAFTANIGVTLPAALAAQIAAREIAKKLGKPYGTLLTTTAGKKDDIDGNYVFNEYVLGAMPFNEKLFDCENLEALQQTISKNTKNGNIRVNCTFNHRQLGYTDEWMKSVISETGLQGEDADRDLFNKWTSGSITSPFTVKISEAIRTSEKEPLYTQITNVGSYVIRWYIPEGHVQIALNNEMFIMGLDTSDAIGGDDISMNIVRVKTGEVVASGNFNETNLITFSTWLCDFLVNHKKVLLIPEKRSTGQMIVDYLLLMLPDKGEDPFRRIFNKIVDESDEYPDRFKEISRGNYRRDSLNEYKKFFGYATSSAGTNSRNTLYGNVMKNAVKFTSKLLRDSTLINQLLSLIVKDGRIDHPAGMHDDSVISFLLAHWVLTMGKNLSHYGIDSREIYSENIEFQDDHKSNNSHEKVQQSYLKYEIENLVKTLEVEPNEFIIFKLEHKLKTLVNQLSETDQKILSVDDLINKLRENKRRRY